MLRGAKAMKSLPHRPAKLRTKTGCLTCRSRRKKCDEKSPICGRCSHSNRECLWPTSADLVDRRYANHERSRYATSRAGGPGPPMDASVESSLVFRASESVAHRAMSRDLEGVIARHFIEQYYGLLLLPNCHPDFYNGWIEDIQMLMTEFKSVRYSVLCNAASNLHLIKSSGMMQELALTYYSQAMRGLSNIISRTEPLARWDIIMMSMMLLYLHGCMGRGTYFDIPRHLNAATHFLTLQLFKQDRIISSPFDRLAVESVLYQIFVVSTGLWSDEEVNHKVAFDFDPIFWLRAERLLDQSSVFPGLSYSTNSPVLGVPVPLFRLALTSKQMYEGTVSYDQGTLDALRKEIEVWEGLVLRNQETDELSEHEVRNHKHAFYTSASYLFIITISLLSQQLNSPSIFLDEHTDDSDGPTKFRSRPPAMAEPDSWQIQKAVEILEGYRNDDEWASCFIGNWPVYSIGFFMRRSEHAQLVRKELQRRWELTKFNQLARFWTDLEKTWEDRGLKFDDELSPVGRCWVKALPMRGTS